MTDFGELWEYDEAWQRFKQDVDISKIKDKEEFQTKVIKWAELKKTPGKRLANKFIKLLTPTKRKRLLREVPVEEIIPTKMDMPKKWTRMEITILKREKGRKRGYAKRVAALLDFERSLKSIYMKAYWTQKRGKK